MSQHQHILNLFSPKACSAGTSLRVVCQKFSVHAAVKETYDVEMTDLSCIYNFQGENSCNESFICIYMDGKCVSHPLSRTFCLCTNFKPLIKGDVYIGSGLCNSFYACKNMALLPANMCNEGKINMSETYESCFSLTPISFIDGACSIIQGKNHL